MEYIIDADRNLVWQEISYRCDTIKKISLKDLPRIILGFGPDTLVMDFKNSSEQQEEQLQLRQWSDKRNLRQKLKCNFRKHLRLDYPSFPERFRMGKGTFRLTRFCYCNPAIKVVLAFVTSLVYHKRLTSILQVTM